MVYCSVNYFVKRTFIVRTIHKMAYRLYVDWSRHFDYRYQ